MNDWNVLLMRRVANLDRLCLLLAIASIFFLHFGGRTGEPELVLSANDDAEATLKKAIKAHGGKSTFTCWKCGFLKYQLKSFSAGADFQDAIFEDTFDYPAHSKRVILATVDGRKSRLEFVVRRGEMWMKTDDGKAQLLRQKPPDFPQHPLGANSNLEPLTESDVIATKLGLVRDGNRDLVGIRVKSQNLNEVDFYFDLKDGLIRKSKKKAQLEGDAAPTVIESYLDDYTFVRNVAVPRRIRGTSDGKTVMDVVILEVRFMDKLEDVPFPVP